MTDQTIRAYEAGRFSSILAPAWFDRAVETNSSGKLDWQHAISEAIGADHQGLTVDATGPVGLDISFWYSLEHGVYVEIDSELGCVEQVLIRDPADWLPFISTHLTPLLGAVGQVATAQHLERIANALISFGRHEHGDHIDRWTGRSRIDERRDEEYRARQRAKAGK